MLTRASVCTILAATLALTLAACQAQPTATAPAATATAPASKPTVAAPTATAPAAATPTATRRTYPVLPTPTAPPATPTAPVLTPAAPTATRQPYPVVPTPTLAPPESDAPAAGICARAEGEWATVEINTDTPSPRCLQVTAAQKLKVLNRTAAAIQVRLAGYTVSVPAGGEGTIAFSFGSYLALGVHTVQAAPYSGPQIWLVQQ